MTSQLNPGQSMWISGDSKTWITVERSGNGKTLRYVRNTPSGSVVFKVLAF